MTAAETSGVGGELWFESFEVVLDQCLCVGLGELPCHQQCPDSVRQSHHFQGEAARGGRTEVVGLQDAGEMISKSAQMLLVGLPRYVRVGDRQRLQGDSDAMEIFARRIGW